YILGRSIYNAYFHPLARFPGPRTWGFTRLFFMTSLFRGNLHMQIKSFHDLYGPVVRVAPNELSFIDGAAWEDIYTKFNKNKGLPKNDVFMSQDFHSFFDSIGEEHTQVRKTLAHAFSEQALANQEPVIQAYVTTLVNKLHEVAQDGKIINIVEWFNWFSFDVTGALTFSESFDQLEDTTTHPWTKMISSHLTYSSFNACLRFWPPLDRLLPLLAPPSLRRLKRSFLAMSRDKVQRRLEREDLQKLDDIVATYFSAANKGEDILTTETLVGTFTFLIVAGSETTATALAGITNVLCHHPQALARLKEEVRSVSNASDLTIASTAAMPYLCAVIKEGLRFCHPVPASISRIVPQEGKVIGGHFVPGNTLVGIPQYAAYFSETNFESPYEFLPERWIGGDGSEEARSIFRPFAVGGRSCLGQNLARAELRLVLARVIYDFDLEMEHDLRWHDQKSYFLWHKEPFLVRI
ncbi:cytochrome P450, partial [Aspergillus sclerotioniger CBS 115572]